MLPIYDCNYNLKIKAILHFFPFSEQDNYISLENKLPAFLELEILQRTIKSLLKHEIEDSSRDDYSVSIQCFQWKLKKLA